MAAAIKFFLPRHATPYRFVGYSTSTVKIYVNGRDIQLIDLWREKKELKREHHWLKSE